MVALSAQQLCLGKVGNPLNFRADPCCHDNEIWHRHGDLAAYRLVKVTVQVVVWLLGGVGLVLEPDNCTCTDGRERSSDPTSKRFSRSSTSTEGPSCRVHIQEGRATEGRTVQRNVAMWKDSRTVRNQFWYWYFWWFFNQTNFTELLWVGLYHDGHKPWPWRPQQWKREKLTPNVQLSSFNIVG